MCEDCGCDAEDHQPLKRHSHEHVHDGGELHTHDHDHPHDSDHAHYNPHAHEHAQPDEHAHPHATRTLSVREGILAKNERLAERNRGYFLAKKLRVLNVLSSPGSGKTALLERTLTELGERLRMAVIVGDLQTDNDARRLSDKGAPVHQITTGNVCHLDAEMIWRSLEQMPLENVRLLFIENVGNLVCPSSYDLGEDGRVVLLSVTEGEDKPLKYPAMFKSANLVLLTKTDLAAAVGFDRNKAVANLHAVAPQARLMELSARDGAGLPAWYAYLEDQALHERPR